MEHIKHHIKRHLDTLPKERLNLIIGAIVLIVVIIAVAIFAPIKISRGLSVDQAKAKVVDYINTNLLKGKATAVIDEISSAGDDIYKLKISVNGQSAGISYMSKDGSFFFPQAFIMSSSTEEKINTANQAKSDKPKVELFVMSYCPYGTQIEKGIIPAVEALGDKIDFNLKFVSYAMHGQKELTENTTQYCINKEQNNKFLPYLKCFLKKGDSASCLNTIGIDQNKLASCVKSTDQQFKINEQFTNKQNYNGDFPPFDIDKADNQKYGVQGSPTLIINGSQVESERDSASLLKTICSSFNKQPEICSTAKLSSDSPAPGFGEASAPSAGPAAAAAGCASN